MKKKCIFVIAALIVSLMSTELVSGQEKGAVEKTKAGKVTVSIGYKQVFAWWQPVWEKKDNSNFDIITASFGVPSITQDITLQPDPDFLYNPVFSISLPNKWSISGSFLYGNFSCKRKTTESYYFFAFGTTVNPFSSYSKKIEKYDADLLFNYQANRYLKIFFGPKYQGYNLRFVRDVIFASGIRYTDSVLFHSIGGGIGTAFTIPVYKGFFFLPTVSGIFLWGRDYSGNSSVFNSLFTPTRETSMYIVGANGGVEFAYYIEKINLTVTAGFRCQYLYYLQNVRQDFVNKYDLFYGPSITLVYTF